MRASGVVCCGALLLVQFQTLDAFAQELLPPPPAAARETPEPRPSLPSPQLPKFDALAGIVAQPGGLTSEATAVRATETSSQLEEKRAELDAANARMQTTRRQPLPILSLRASYTRLSPLTTSLGDGASVGARNEGMIGLGPCSPQAPDSQCVVDSAGNPIGAARNTIEFPNNTYALNASLTIPISDLLLRYSNAVALASKDRESAKYALEAERLKVRAEARVLYFNWLSTHGHVSIARQAVVQTRARLEEAKNAFELGAVSQADMLKIQALVANAERAVSEAENARELASRQLSIVLHDRGGANYQVGEEVPDTEVAEADLRNSDELVNAALARRLEIKSVQSAAQSLVHAKASLSATRLPRVDGVGQLDYGNPNQRYFPPTPVWRHTWSVGVVASWNLTEAFILEGRVNEIAAKRESLLAQGKLIAEGIASEIAMAQSAVKNAKAVLASAGVTLLAQQESYRVASESFALGKVTATFLSDAEADLFNARLALLHGRIDLTTAAIRLEHALGHDTERL